MNICNEKQTAIKELIGSAIADGAFPGASVEVGTPTEIIFDCCVGNRSVYPEKLPLDKDTLFDMASLTKVCSTTPLTMVFIENGLISLADKVGDYIDGFSTEPWSDITLAHLLTHTAGLVSHLPIYKVCSNYDYAIRYIRDNGISHKPGVQVVYSDLGFILMGHILELVGKDNLANLCTRYIYQKLGMNQSGFCPTSQNIASTELDPASNTWLCGTVHDENARFFKGISGHAGLFSNAHDLSKYAAMLLNCGEYSGSNILSPASINAMTKNYTYHLGEDRGIGWCIKTGRLPGTDSYASATGELVSPGSYGHTGFTGTSIWIDQTLGVYIICLTNRVHYGRDNIKILRFRRLLHNMVFSGLKE